MLPLNLPNFTPNLRVGQGGKQEIFDICRKKFVRLTPEEWVRQTFLSYLINHQHFSASLLVVEAQLTFNKMIKRFDILAYGSDGKPRLVVECKAPTVEITQAVFDQVAMYNMTLTVDYLVVTNGLTHYSCKIDHQNRTYQFLSEIPTFETISIINP